MSTFLVFTPQASTTASSATTAATISGTAPRYDAFKKDLVLGPDGEPILGNVWETLADETMIGLLIRRGRYPEFDPAFGTAFDQDASQPSYGLQEAAFQADIEAQVARQSGAAIRSVAGFTFTRETADSLRVAFTITPVVGPAIDVLVPWSAMP